VADIDDSPKPAKSPPTAPKALGPKPSVQLGGESLVDRLMPHVKTIGIGIVLTAVFATIVVVIRTMKERTRQDTTEKLEAALSISQRNVEPPTTPVDPANPTKKAPGDDSFPTAKDRAIAALTEIDKSGANVDPGYRAAIELNAGKIDDAITHYRQAGTAAGFDGIVAREGLGIALETKATDEKDPAARQRGLEDALAAFVSEQPDEAGPRRAYALYHQARMLELLGKRDDAKAALTKAKDLAKDETAMAENAARQQDPPSAEAGKFLPDLIERRLAALGGS
jgi:tetratricopeptide (TPR) repeat protein